MPEIDDYILALQPGDKVTLVILEDKKHHNNYLQVHASSNGSDRIKSGRGYCVNIESIETKIRIASKGDEH